MREDGGEGVWAGWASAWRCWLVVYLYMAIVMYIAHIRAPKLYISKHRAIRSIPSTENPATRHDEQS